MSAGTQPQVFADRIGRIEVSATMAVSAEAAKLRAQARTWWILAPASRTSTRRATSRMRPLPPLTPTSPLHRGSPAFPTYARPSSSAMPPTLPRTTRWTKPSSPPAANLALFNTIQVLVEHGDEVILPVPYWVSFKDIIQYAGGKVVFLQTSEAESFRITADAIEKAITPRTKAIILNSPSNPRGFGRFRGGSGAYRPLGPRARHFPAFGRVLCLFELCRQTRFGRLVHVGKRSHCGTWLALQDLRHDRLARRICPGFQEGRSQPQQAPVAVHLQRHQLCAEGRHCRSVRTAGLCLRVPRRVHRPARPHAGQTGRNSRRHLHQAGGARSTFTPIFPPTSAKAASKPPPSWLPACSTRRMWSPCPARPSAPRSTSACPTP